MKSHVLTLINDIAQRLQVCNYYYQEAQQAAWWILQALTNRTRIQLFVHGIEDKQAIQQKLDHWLNELCVQHKPLQYLIGNVPFCGLTILVEPPVLIPRPETEEWCYQLIHLLKIYHHPLSILDLGTGTGCIALALAKHVSSSYILATDINQQAIELTKKNATKNSITNVECIISDLYQKVPKHRFDIIISNPPYISPQEWATISPRVRDWEDQKALVAHDQGLAIIKQIIAQARQYLTKTKLSEQTIPRLVLEIGYQQTSAVTTLMQDAGFSTSVWKDLYGKDRVILGFDVP